MTTSHGSLAPVLKLEGKMKGKVVCFILGMGVLVSWNTLMAIEDYYYQVFPEYHPSRLLTVIYLLFALATLSIFAYYGSNINTRLRNMVGYSVFFAGTLLVLILDLWTSGRGGIGPFIVLCLLWACVGIADAHVQGGMVGEVSSLCPDFLQSFLAGMAGSGVIITALRFLTEAAFKKVHNGHRKAAISFLALSTFFEFVCAILYMTYFPVLPMLKYSYGAKAAIELALENGATIQPKDLNKQAISNIITDHEGQSQERLSSLQLLFQNKDFTADSFFIAALSFSIFPGFLYENTGSHSLGSWYPLVLIAAYNVGNLLSRYIPLIEKLKLESRKGLMLAILSRSLLVPAFYFASKYGDQGWTIFLTTFLGSSNGYLHVCVLTMAPKRYKGPERNALGNLLILFLFWGMFSGVALGWLWIIGKGGKF